jgi:transcriptional regulator with XRE-family HTH domain
MKSKLAKTLGKNMRELRLKKGWSQEELAAQAGLSPNFIGYVERGERGVRIGNIEQIARALAIHPKDLFKGY